MNTKVIALVATVAIIAAAAVGIGYAYSATTTNSGNSITAEYITLTQQDYSFGQANVNLTTETNKVNLNAQTVDLADGVSAIRYKIEAANAYDVSSGKAVELTVGGTSTKMYKYGDGDKLIVTDTLSTNNSYLITAGLPTGATSPIGSIFSGKLWIVISHGDTLVNDNIDFCAFSTDGANWTYCVGTSAAPETALGGMRLAEGTYTSNLFLEATASSDWSTWVASTGFNPGSVTAGTVAFTCNNETRQAVAQS